MKLHPRLATGIFGGISLGLVALIMKLFNLGDKFYYICLFFIIIAGMFVYDYFDSNYKKEDNEKRDSD